MALAYSELKVRPQHNIQHLLYKAVNKMQKSVHSKVYLTVVFVKKSKKTKNIKHKHKSKQENTYISLEMMIFCSVSEI